MSKKSAAELSLTVPEREALIEGTGLRSKLKNRLKSLPDDGIVIELSRKEIDQVALEVSAAASNPLHVYASLLTEIDRKLKKLAPATGNGVRAGQRPPRTTPVATNEVLQFRISLRDIEPEIWRRIQVEDCTLGEFHFLIQRVFGWENCHMHVFDIEGKSYGTPTELIGGFGDFFACDILDEDEHYLSDFIASHRSKPRWQYEYDFGDSWWHTIKFEGFQPKADETAYPLCLEGARTCPPEDIGGPWGYFDLLESLEADQGGAENGEDTDDDDCWYADYDPEAFDLKAVNERLR